MIKKCSKRQIKEETRGAFFICEDCGNPNAWTASNSGIQKCNYCGVRLRVSIEMLNNKLSDR